MPLIKLFKNLLRNIILLLGDTFVHVSLGQDQTYSTSSGT